MANYQPPVQEGPNIENTEAELINTSEKREEVVGEQPEKSSNVGEASKTIPKGSPCISKDYDAGITKLDDSSDVSIDLPSTSRRTESTSDDVSTVPLVPSDDSITQDAACFNWFKRVGRSPKRLMSRLKDRISIREQKSQRPILSSQCDADGCRNEASPGLSPISDTPLYYFPCPRNILSETMVGDRIDFSNLTEDKIIPVFLSMYPCYDLMPTSGKVVILEVNLVVQNAFNALVRNQIKAAPLWDSSLMDFVGMLTISDFINVLRHYYYTSPENIKDIENQTISAWRRITNVSKPLTKVYDSDSLAQATKVLTQEGVHRIPVVDKKKQCMLFVLTRKRILHFLSYRLFENFKKANIKTPSFFRKTLRDLQVGTYENIATIGIGAKVIEALDLFVERKVSSLPVVDDGGVLKDIFEKFDVFALAKERAYHNLDMTVLEAITKVEAREGAYICTLDETFGTVVNRFVRRRVHRIVVIDERRMVVGVISLSDILTFLVVQPLVSMEDSSVSRAAKNIEDSEGAVGGSVAEISVFVDTEQESSKCLQDTEDLGKESSVLEGVADLKISGTLEETGKASASEDVSKDIQSSE